MDWPPQTWGARVKVEVPTTETPVSSRGTSMDTVSNPRRAVVPVHTAFVLVSTTMGVSSSPEIEQVWVAT